MNSVSIITGGKKAKKLIVACEILIFVLFVAKILALGGIIKKAESTYTFFPLNQAQADPSLAGSGGYAVRDVLDGGLTEEKKLMDHLTERQRQLDLRENLLRSEEKRLDSLKQEIVAKIENLRVLEEKLSVPLAGEDKKVKDLAKVYEATPPAQVGSILEKMDRKTAAAIISSMSNKKAGQIWGHMSPAKAVEIAKELADSKRGQ